MKKIVLPIVIALFPGFLSGQIDEKPKKFLCLFPDSMIYASDIKYHRQSLGKDYFIVDSLRIYSGSVKFYNNETGFYAQNENGDFIRMIKEGRVNLFEYKFTTYQPAPGYYNPYTGIYFPSLNPPIQETFTKYYYNKGFGDLKKVNYQNLKIDLSDNPESMFHIIKYKSLRKAQISTFIIGSACMFGPLIVSNITGTQNSKLASASFIGGVCVGILAFSASGVIKYIEPNSLRLAIYDYNR
jgi:hypothetical protein